MSKTAAGGRPAKHNTAMGDPIGVRLPKELVAKVDEAAKERGWTRNEEIRRRLAESFSPLSDEAGAMGNVLALVVQQIQELTGKPFHEDPFSWIALHSALRLLVPPEPDVVAIPEALAAEAVATRGGNVDATDFADGVGVRVWGELMRMLKHIDQPGYAEALPPGRRRFIEAIHQDFGLHKIWAGNAKSGFVAPPKSVKSGNAKKKEPSK